MPKMFWETLSLDDHVKQFVRVFLDIIRTQNLIFNTVQKFVNMLLLTPMRWWAVKFCLFVAPDKSLDRLVYCFLINKRSDWYANNKMIQLNSQLNNVHRTTTFDIVT